MSRYTLRAATLIAVGVLIAACSSTNYSAYSDLGYTSGYALSGTAVGAHDIARFTTAPQQTIYMVEFDRARSEIFPLMLTEVADYTEMVTKTRFDHSRSANPGQMGVGSIRICDMADGRSLVEPLVVYEQDRFYAYRVDRERSTMKMPIDNVVLFYSFEDMGADKTLMTIRVHYDADGRVGERFIDAGFDGMVTPSFEKAAKLYDGRMIDPAS